MLGICITATGFALLVAAWLGGIRPALGSSHRTSGAGLDQSLLADLTLCGELAAQGNRSARRALLFSRVAMGIMLTGVIVGIWR